MARIIIAVNKWVGSIHFAQAIREYLKHHELAWAAYSYKPLPWRWNWNLSSCLNYLNPDSEISINNFNFKKFLVEFADWKPDLIISELDPISAMIGVYHKIPVWSISPLLIWNGLEHKNLNEIGPSKYNGIRPAAWKQIKNCINYSEKKLIYSFCGEWGPYRQIHEHFTWIRPYTSNNIENNGSTSEIQYCLEHNITPTINIVKNDPESLLNFNILKKWELQYSKNWNCKFLHELVD